VVLAVDPRQAKVGGCRTHCQGRRTAFITKREGWKDSENEQAKKTADHASGSDSEMTCIEQSEAAAVYFASKRIPIDYIIKSFYDEACA
jgi:hypothetical protein